MTITSALNAALSGLNAASRASGIVSSNIANANTPGYARRTLSISSASNEYAGGVRIDGITRHVDAQLIADRRMAGAELGYRTETTRFLNSIEDSIGTPDQDSSLAARLSDFENALITASSRPDAVERLNSAVFSARDLASAINAVADGIQDERSLADRSIAGQVTRLNDALEAVETLNGQIVSASVQKFDTSALEDQRQAVIDEITEMVPVRQIARDHNAVALYSTGGAVLVDFTAAKIEFDPSNTVTPYMSVGDGSLSGLTLNGFAISTSSQNGKLGGGTLGAQFEIRDELAPQAQVQIDAIARDLIERFEDPAVDPTLAAGQPGLFTDQGAAFDPLAEQGLATRLSVNALVDPEQGGESWRMRDGIGAAAPGDVGNAQLLNALVDAFSAARTVGSGSFGSAPHSAVGLTGSFASQLGVDHAREDQLLSFSSSQFYQLSQLELENGVDTDVEIQNLMIVEQAYAANARVIQTVDEMLDTLMRL